MDSNAKKDDDDKRTEEQKRWAEMYRQMGDDGYQRMPTTPQPAESPVSDDEEDDVEDEDKGSTDDEPECVECGQGPGVYPDDDLDRFVENRDEEPIHGGCRKTGM